MEDPRVKSAFETHSNLIDYSEMLALFSQVTCLSCVIIIYHRDIRNNINIKAIYLGTLTDWNTIHRSTKLVEAGQAICDVIDHSPPESLLWATERLEESGG